MNDSQKKYNALEAIAVAIRIQSGKAEINTGDMTVKLSSHFWHMSLTDVMHRGPLSAANIEMLHIEHERAFEIQGIKFIRGDK